jgi:hypothetical protein
MRALEQMDPAVFFDHTLRFQVPSGSDPHVTYLVQLDSYSGNGECDCPAFNFPRKKGGDSMRTLLAKRVTPEQAFQSGQVNMPKTGRVSDCLRCKHIIDARDQLASAVIRCISHAEKIHSNQKKH